MIKRQFEAMNVTESNAIKESSAVFKTSQGVETHARLVRLTRFAVVFEVSSPESVLRTSEVLKEFQILLHDRVVYDGRAVIHNVLNTGPAAVCEATLTESSCASGKARRATP